jgi:NADH-quinone oxidoreductase subunit B/C/D
VAVIEDGLPYSHPIYDVALKVPGGAVAVGNIDTLLTWGVRNSLWIFPMATSCCGIELMAAAAARVDLDRMGTIIRGTPRQSDVMVVAGTITVKMAPRVRKLWDQMPEPKWCIAMGSCAISGDFYRNLYPVVPGIDTVVPVDVYVPGCPPNPEALMAGLLRLQEKVKNRRKKLPAPADVRPSLPDASLDAARIKRVNDPERDPAITLAQTESARRPGDEVMATPPPLPSPPEPFAPVQTARDWPAVLQAQFGVDAVPQDGSAVLPVERVVEAARAARDNGYSLLCYVVATHFPAPAAKEGEPKGQDELEVAYGFRRPTPGAALATFRVRVPAEQAVPSISAVYVGADWQEREQHDLLGVRFDGHPDLRRILLPEAWQGHPLRRDYAHDAPAHPWR